MYFIKKVEISNFRSIYYQEIECSGYNLFCGLNDVGKSNVLKALNLFFNGETDFQAPLNFQSDYNKISLAKAQKSAKQKQLIKIKVTFHIPVGYKSLADLNDFTIEKTFDRSGREELRYSDQNSTKRASMSRIMSKVKFVYIPALKGESVIQYLLGLLGEYQLISSNNIETLNNQINVSTSDLTELLNTSKIGMGTVFGLPTLLSDFWQKLSVSTVYEQFGNLEPELEKSARVKGKNLNLTNYLIPLTMRGDGIKSKYIPPLLQWLQKNNKKSVFIWAIDEPENSLEFRAAEELSQLFSNVYAKETQIFGTTHSMAFINPEENALIKPLVFRCKKSNLGETLIYPLNDLFKKEDSNDLLEELGALQTQKSVITEYRAMLKEQQEKAQKLDSEVKYLAKKIEQISKPLIITEGKTDIKHMKKAMDKLGINDLDMEFIDPDCQPHGGEDLDKLLEKLSKIDHPNKIVGIFDRDVSDIVKTVERGGQPFKHYGKGVYAFCVPVPTVRLFTNQKDISIEYLYTDDEIKTKLRNGTRLFFGTEFNRPSMHHNSEELTLGVTDGKGKEKIIENNGKQAVYDKTDTNVLAKKDEFAEAILKDEIDISQGSWENFRPIFNTIRTISLLQ